MQAKKGKFIVIDGTNGSGKATQTEKLVKVLKKQKKNILFVDFPQYGKRSATLVEDYLNGKFGSAEEVGPYRASILFACDRYAASKKIQQHLDNGEIVISNRYTPSNMAHQTAQIPKKVDKEKYLEWLNDLEYELFKIPKPDLVIILYNPPQLSQKWVDKKGYRKYVKGQKRDIHEADANLLRRAADAYKYISEKYNWPIIKADQDREQVHKEIMKCVGRLVDEK